MDFWVERRKCFLAAGWTDDVHCIFVYLVSQIRSCVLMDGRVLSKKGWVPFRSVARRLKLAAPLLLDCVQSLTQGLIESFFVCRGPVAHFFSACLPIFPTYILLRLSACIFCHDLCLCQRPMLNDKLPCAASQAYTVICLRYIALALLLYYKSTRLAGASLHIHCVIYAPLKLAVYFSCPSCRKLLF